MTDFVSSYRDYPGLTNRANGAMIRIEAILSDYALPSATRLVLIAEVMKAEPVLTDHSVAAITARKDAAKWVARRSARLEASSPAPTGPLTRAGWAERQPGPA